MLSDEESMQHEPLDQEEVWASIRYLDPDAADQDREAKTARRIAVFALLLMLCGVCVVFWLRIRAL